MVIELGLQAYNALKHNRRRSILTMLGMAWGIATVVLLLAYGTGFERGLWVAFRSWGTNLIFIFPGRTSLQVGGTKAGVEVKLTTNDLDNLQAEVPLIKRISPESSKQSTAAFGIRSGNYSVSGVYPYYSHMRRMDVEFGSFFTELDEKLRMPLETVIAFWTQTDTRHHFKVFKRLEEVVADDLPPTWMKNALIALDGDGLECC